MFFIVYRLDSLVSFIFKRVIGYKYTFQRLNTDLNTYIILLAYML